MTLPTSDNPGEYGHYVGMTVEERKVADTKKRMASPATPAQLAAIAERADLIERECPGPYTRAEAKAEIARLDARIKELMADGTLVMERITVDFDAVQA